MTQKQMEQKFFREVRKCVKAMIVLEKEFGHHGVFSAIKDWLNDPHRGTIDPFTLRRKP